MDFVRKRAANEAERNFMEQQAFKYDEFEEEVHRFADEEDTWIEPEDRPGPE